MHTGKGQIAELILLDGIRHARIACPAELIPAPGQYLLASDASDSPLPLPAPLFCTELAPDGFLAAPAPGSWTPGLELSLRGPLGRGFAIPHSARKICLTAFDDTPARMRGLIRPALNQGAAVVLLVNSSVEDLPDAVEIQPVSSLIEIIAWADYAAFDVSRENLPGLVNKMREVNQSSTMKAAEVFIHTPVPCGGLADCGVCAVTIKSGWKMACKDGPVFDLSEFSSPIGRGQGEG